MRGIIVTLLTAATVLVPVQAAVPARAANPTHDQQWARIQQLVGAIKGRWTTQVYSNAVSRTMPDTALIGNGDVGVTSSGGDGFKRFYVAKADFWNGNPGPTIVPIGNVAIRPVASSSSSNLALGSAATATSSHPNFPPSRAVNGQWGPGYEGWVSEIGKPQAITLDLGTSMPLGHYIVRHDSAARPAETAYNTKNFTLAVSGNNSTWTTVDTVNDNTAALTDRTFSSVSARFVRLATTEPTQGTTPDSINNPRARIGQLELYAPGGGPGPSAPFVEEQNILKGDIDTTMTIGGIPVVMRTWLAPVDNFLVTQIQSQGSSAVRLRAETTAGSPEPRSGFTNTSGFSGNTTWATRQTAGGSNWVSRASLASRVIGANLVGTPTSSGATATSTFDLQPGQTVRIVTAIAGGGRNPTDPAPAARSMVDGQSAGSLDSLYNAHIEWWKRYWLRSYVDIGDDVLQRFYYGSLYLLGSSSRAGKTAPGLYGVWITSDFPAFNGDMHLNYNWMANFYGAYSSNRPQVAVPYFDLVQAYLPEARRRAQQDLRRVNPGYVDRRFPSGGVPSGVLFPVGIGPFGSTTDNNYHQQVVDALFTVTQYIAYYDYTQDRSFLSGKAYPFMKEVAAFFRSWLEFDQGAQRYHLWSGPHEGTWGRNSSPDVGMLRSLLAALIDASIDLNVDAGDRQVWTDILNRLAPIPTTTVNGQRVYALADPGTISDGRAIRPGDNTVNLEFIHPGEVLGIRSPAADRQTAINTLNVMNSWGQDNSFPKVFTQAARVGYPAANLIDRLRGQINAKMVANLRIADGVHGLEKAGAIEAVNNMLLQSDDGVIHVFPVWPSERNAGFVKLREKDAFLVSSARSGGRVSYVDIASEAGKQVRLQHPWPGQNITVTQIGGGSVGFTIQNNVIAFATQAGATYTVVST